MKTQQDMSSRTGREQLGRRQEGFVDVLMRVSLTLSSQIKEIMVLVLVPDQSSNVTPSNRQYKASEQHVILSLVSAVHPLPDDACFNLLHLIAVEGTAARMTTDFHAWPKKRVSFTSECWSECSTLVLCNVLGGWIDH